MPNFKCKVISNDGISSIVYEYGQDEESVSETLSKHFEVIYVKEVRQKKIKKLSKKDLLFFFEYFYQLIKIGISIQDILQIVSSETKNKKVQSFTTRLYELIQSGKMVSEAMSEVKAGIPQFYISIIKLGETSNNLAGSFEYVIHYVKTSSKINSKVSLAMAYPLFLVAMLMAMIISASMFLIPKLTEFATSLGIKLPKYTIALISFSDFVRSYWQYILLSLFVAVVGSIVLGKTSKKFRYFLDSVKLKIPVLNSIIVKSDMARFCLFFSIAYKSGSNISQCIDSALDIISNAKLRKSIGLIVDKILSGYQISDAMSESPLIPRFVIRMFRIGENTGDISTSLDNVITLYTEQISVTTEVLLGVIKPVGIFCAGGLLIWMVASIMLPIYSQFAGNMLN